MNLGDRFHVAHRHGIVGSYDHSVRAHRLNQVLQRDNRVHDGIEIDLLKILRGSLGDIFSEIAPLRVGVVQTPNVIRQESASVGKTEPEIGILFKDSFQDHPFHH